LRRTETALRGAMARALASARLDGRRRVLEARDVLLDRLFARARELLAEAIQQPAARRRLAERASEALEFIPAGAATIQCSPGVAPILEAELRDLLEREPQGVRVETDPELPPGFRVVGAGGSLTVDATLEKLLELDRPILAIEVLRRLEREQA